jgi:outer membrane protein OmpA-like peptidoglycan-associated protein
MSQLRLLTLLATSVAFAIAAPGAATPINLLSIQEGTFPVIEPASYGGWPVVALLDDSPKTGWACADGKTTDNVFVFEMAAEATLERFEFDAKSVDEEGAGAKEVVIEVSTTSANAGFVPVLEATLAAGRDLQAFAAAKGVPARWVRLTIRNNHGNTGWTELFGFRGYGARPAVAALPEGISGTYATDYNEFHVRQQGSALVGCYEYDFGVLDGAIDGRVMKITWREREDGSERGPAVMVFALDGKSFRGFWWHSGNELSLPDGEWNGTKTSAAVGTCPHWSGSVGGELTRSLTATGRARIYGILFDIDSATIRPESRPVLDEVVGSLRAQPSWQLTVEGHTDSTGTAEHNRVLSQQRADSVKAYLVAAGIDASRLRTAGFGSAQPVADNASELGRSQNRRVELVRDERSPSHRQSRV